MKDKYYFDKTFEFLIDSPNPEALDKVLNSFDATLVKVDEIGAFTKVEGHYVVHCFGDMGYVKFACKEQGYGRLVEDD